MRMIQYPDNLGGKFRFIVIASLRCRQLQKGAQPRLHSRSKKYTTIAQEEVLGGLVALAADAPPAGVRAVIKEIDPESLAGK